MKFTNGCRDRKEMDKLFIMKNNTPRSGLTGHGVFTNSLWSTLTDHDKAYLQIKEKNYGYF